jgi:hypothetical protein
MLMLSAPDVCIIIAIFPVTRILRFTQKLTGPPRKLIRTDTNKQTKSVALSPQANYTG